MAQNSLSTVRANVLCIETMNDYKLECITKGIYGNNAICPNGYEMFGCNAYTNNDTLSLDDYHVTDNGECLVQQDGLETLYSVALCCQLHALEIESASAPTTRRALLP